MVARDAVVDDFVSPAYGLDDGDRMGHRELLRAFLGGAVQGQAPRLRVEGPLLITTSGAVAALWLDSRVVLVRAQGVLSDSAADIREELMEAGLHAVLPDPPLADVVALMMCGLRGTPWDLWGENDTRAVQAMERVATGDIHVDLLAAGTQLATDLVIADYEADYGTDTAP